MITNYKKCENYSEKTDDLFDNNPNITVVGCKFHGIKTCCSHKNIWNTCLVSRENRFYRYKYRLKSKRSLHAQLHHIYYDKTEENNYIGEP